MQRSARKFLHDAQEACSRVLRFTTAKSFAEYENDILLRSAVERQLMIVGEALNQARQLRPSVTDEIAAFQRIVDFRNILVHGYSKVENATVWGIVRRHVPPLLEQLNGLLATLPEDS
jgi:uncharacterized protein with HEPN domain